MCSSLYRSSFPSDRSRSIPEALMQATRRHYFDHKQASQVLPSPLLKPLCRMFAPFCQASGLTHRSYKSVALVEVVTWQLLTSDGAKLLDSLRF
jgi:hypothetical protein